MKFSYICLANRIIVTGACLLAIFLNLPVGVIHADEVDEGAVEVTPSPDATLVLPEPVQNVHSVHMETTAPSPKPSPNPSSTPSPEPTPTPTPSPKIEITHSQEATTATNVNQTATTGTNTIIDQVKAELLTQTATASTQIEIQLNTNLVGQNLVQETVNVQTPGQGTVDLADSLPTSTAPTQAATVAAQPASSAATTTIENMADVQNNVKVTADTGQNLVTAATASATTSDATAESQIFNQLNTSLIGECGYFGIVNVWAAWQGDIHLPNPDEYLQVCQPSDQSNDPSHIEVTNTASVETNVTTTSNTGENQVTGATEVNTGQAQSQSQVVERSNTTYTGHDWWLVRILNPENWRGSLVGSQLTPFTIGKTQYYGWQPTARSGVGGATLTIHNMANLENNVQATANTGRNTVSADQSQLETGDALARSQLISYLNTVLAGNRWYLADINLLAELQGDIVLSKPDVAISAHTSETELFVGQRQVLGFRVYNEGQSRALATTVKLILPVGVKAIASQPGAKVDGQEVTWVLGEVPAGGYYEIYLLIEAEKEMDELLITGFVSTSLSEGSYHNNHAATKITARNRPVATQNVVQQSVQVGGTRRQQSQVRTTARTSAQIQPAVDGGVLGATTDTASNLVASLPTLNDATPTGTDRFCSRMPWVCQSTQYAFAGVMLAAYIYNKRKYIDWW